ncbi:unnamed protein product [Orchesella dallaii]|uniref:C2H2-type domain-containing protein n=1 Tax=Orchesella dallaii TaxID=48710 RepID=A0ABP1R645_9HEXA
MNPVSQQSTSTSTASAPPVQKRLGHTTCLLCHIPVCINLNKTVSSLEELKRQKWVENLCNYRGITLMIPESCSETKFPFCEYCKQRLEQLSFHWENLEETFNGIESEVADGEIRRMSTATSGVLPTDDELEKQKCSVLRDVLLEGYRFKLLANQRQRNAMQGQLKNRSSISSSFTSFSDLHRVSRSLSTPLCHMVPVPETQVIDLDCEDQDADATLETDWENDDEVSDLEDENDNSDSSFLRISNIRSVSSTTEMDSDLGLDAASGAPKQEIGGNSYQNDQEEGPEESSDHDEIFQLAVTHRRKQCGGIEIFSVVGKGSATQAHDSLQCGRCNFTVPDRKLGKREETGTRTPLQKIKAHILAVHFGQGQTTATRNTVPNGQYFGEINTCKICGRPVRGPPFMLKQHKFFHMNDMERQAAVDAGLKGMYTSKRLANKTYPKVGGISSKNKAVLAQNILLKSKNVMRGKTCVFKCYECGKLFPNELSLRHHAAQHTLQGSYVRRSSRIKTEKRKDWE